MLNEKSQSGFTLIEIMLTMAIAALLAATAFAGQGSFRARAQFLDAVERARNDLVNYENQATTGKNASSPFSHSSGGTSPNQTFFGIRVLFSPTGYYIDSIYRDANQPPSNQLQFGEHNYIGFPYGVHWVADGSSSDNGDSIVFIQNQSSAKKEAYTFNEADDLHRLPLSLSDYAPGSAYQKPRNYHLCDSANAHCVDITVDPADGAVTRGVIQ
ncbi:MAG TPA: prepilin-type N-terminal cleavage/methylation domain-containing protein [Candidatus Nanoarchaeia archaeon]|nr:prepilin-type N-terminal cleavage/methylation domain-containing protein [Candidatus Nanoarchaeia archaeon]